MGSPYSFPFACFACRRSFKRGLTRAGLTRTCPNCAGVALRMGRHFKAPPAGDAAAWEVVRFLVEHGFLYDRITTEAGTRTVFPATLDAAREFVQRHRSRLPERARIEVNDALRRA